MLNDSEEWTLGSANDRVGPGRYSKLAKSVNKAQQYPQFSGEPLNSLPVLRQAPESHKEYIQCTCYAFLVVQGPQPMN